MQTTDDKIQAIVVGAGLSGLACARTLHDAGATVRVLERANGVGGRCATWRLEGQPVDHGVFFLHGGSPAFVDAWSSIPDRLIHGWPRRVEGPGRPCHPDAFRPGERRVALASGLTAWPKHLARGLETSLQTDATDIEGVEGAVLVHTAKGAQQAPHVVLALAGEQTRKLLSRLAVHEPEVAAACALLGMTPTIACLSVAALYPVDAAAPPWDILYPDSPHVHVISHDAMKRSEPRYGALVIQSTHRFARTYLDADPETWVQRLLDEAAKHVGGFVRHPLAWHSHRWRHARIDAVSEIGAPMLLRLRHGGSLGLAGESFARGAGTEAAYLSGQQLARRIQQDSAP